MPDIDGIKTDQRCEKPPIRLGQLVPDKIAMARQMRLHPVERGKQLGDCILIGAAGGSKPRLIDPVVDAAIDLVIDDIDLVLQRGRAVIIPVASNAIKGTVEHADDFGRFIRDNLICLAVPQYRHRDPTRRLRVRPGINLMHEAGIMQMIAGAAMRIDGKCPAIIQHQRMHRRDTDMRIKPFQMPENQRAVCPWAGIGQIEMVTATFCRKSAFA